MTNSVKKTENSVQWAVIAAAGESERRVILTLTFGATLQCRGEAAGETTAPLPGQYNYHHYLASSQC